MLARRSGGVNAGFGVPNNWVNNLKKKAEGSTVERENMLKFTFKQRTCGSSMLRRSWATFGD